MDNFRIGSHISVVRKSTLLWKAGEELEVNLEEVEMHSSLVRQTDAVKSAHG